MKKEYYIIFNIHGTRHNQTTLQQAIIRDQQPVKSREALTKIHGIKGMKIM
jgi:hypothetical protein